MYLHTYVGFFVSMTQHWLALVSLRPLITKLFCFEKWQVYKRRKVACLTAYYQSFVNLKSNTMKKSRCKNTAKISINQVILVNNASKACFITYIFISVFRINFQTNSIDILLKIDCKISFETKILKNGKIISE